MAIHKRRDTGMFQLSISYKKPDGSSGRLRRDFKTRREAYEKEPLLRAKIESGYSPDKVSFEAITKEFLESVKKTKRFSTFKHYEKIVRLHILPYFKDKNIRELTQSDIEKWKTLMQNKVSSCSKRKYSFVYLGHCWKVLHLIMTEAKDSYGIINVSMDRVGGFHRDPNEVTPERVLHFWTNIQFQKFIKQYDHDSKQIKDESDKVIHDDAKCLLMICFYAGTRRGEANGLKVEDFHDEEHPFLRIRRSVTEKLGLGHFLETNPKNRSSIRDIPIPKILADEIRDHINSVLKKEYSFSNSFYLCGGPFPVSSTTVDNIKAKVEKECGLPHIRVHDFRHSYVSMLIEANVPITVIAKLAGHSSPQITYSIYGHLMPNTANSAIDQLEQIIKKTGTKAGTKRIRK